MHLDAGDRLAVLGGNGSGKTTLLRTASRIYMPDLGRVSAPALAAAVIDVAPGTERDLTGNEVLALRAAMLGMSGADLSRRRPSIVDFSGIADAAMHSPLGGWSQGMLLRLELSLALDTQPQLLVVDEVFAVADWEFRSRALSRMRTLSNSGTTLIFASHDLQMVEDLAHRAIVLENGSITADAEAAVVVERMRALSLPSGRTRT